MGFKKFRFIRRTLYALLGILILLVYLISYFNRGSVTGKSKEDVFSDSPIINEYRKIQLNRKTPRNLFATFSNASLLLWCGYYKETLTAINCISPVDYKDEPRNLNELITDCNKLCLSIVHTNFRITDIPESVSENNCEVKLGTGENSRVFYLAKRKDGNWYFTKKNISDKKTEMLYQEYLSKTEASDSESKRYTGPLSSFLYFVFGSQKKFGFGYSDAEPVMELDWINPLVRDEYGQLLCFVLLKVMETEKVSLFNVSQFAEPGQDVELLCTSEKLGSSIYLQKKTFNDGVKWIFNRKVLNNAMYMYKFDTMITENNDPLWFSIQHWISVNFPFLQYYLYGISYITWLQMLIGLSLIPIIYGLVKIALNCLLGIVKRKWTIANYEKYSLYLSNSSSLIIAFCVSEWFIFLYLKFYYKWYLCATYILTVILGILFILWLCDIVRFLCCIVIFIAKHKFEQKFRAIFVVEIIQRLLCISIVVLVSGFVLQRVGLNMVQYLTALGIGGLAVAFAGKDTIENLFGSIMIALEGPFRVGDWIIIGEIEGNVEHIGLRSTKIKTFEDSTVSVPNVKFITSNVNNMEKRTYRRYTTTLELVEDTAAEKIEVFQDGINEIIKNTPSMRKKNYYVTVNDIGDYSIKILVYVFFMANDWGEELQERQNFILNILKLAEKMDIKMAYPTQLLYLDKQKKEEKVLEGEDKDGFEVKFFARKLAEKYIKKSD
jgi:MscS family membrane protein